MCSEPYDYIATFSGAFGAITYQAAQGELDPNPVVDPDPVIYPDPGVDPISVVEGEVPAIDSNANKVELTDTIAEVRETTVLLSSGKTLWFNSESIIKYNDASAFEVGQTLEFKAWKNADGALIAVKAEVV